MSNISVTVTNATPINVSVGNSTNISVSRSVSSVSGSAFQLRTEIEVQFKQAQATAYTEFTFDGNGNLTNVDVWTDSGKTTKLFTKVLTFTGDNLTGVSLTDEVSGGTLTKTITYTVGGDIETVTKVVT